MSIASNLGIALRRKAALVALATLGSISLAPAFAAQVTLTGVSTNTCTYSAVAVNGTGDLTVTCTGGAGPGVMSFSPNTYNVNTGATFPVTIVRSGGSTGPLSAIINATTGCTIGANTVNFADGSTTPQTVDVTAGATVGSCTLSSAAFTSQANVSINDPTAPGTFAFQLPASGATPNVAHSIRILRSGGSFGTYQVNYSEVNAGLTGYTTSTPTPITFGTGETFKDIVITNTGTTPGTMTYALAGATGSPATTAAGSHLLTVANASNCPATGSNVTTLPNVPASSTGVLFTGPTPVGHIISVPIHDNVTRLRTLNASNTPSNFNVTFSIAKCPGDVQSTWLTSGAVPCRKQAGYTGNALDITMVPTFAKCHFLAAERAETAPYYMNIRIDNCDSGQCNFRYQQDY